MSFHKIVYATKSIGNAIDDTAKDVNILVMKVGTITKTATEMKVALLIEDLKANGLAAQDKSSSLRWTINTFLVGSDEAADDSPNSTTVGSYGWSNSASGNSIFRIRYTTVTAANSLTTWGVSADTVHPFNTVLNYTLKKIRRQQGTTNVRDISLIVTTASTTWGEKKAQNDFWQAAYKTTIKDAATSTKNEHTLFNIAVVPRSSGKLIAKATKADSTNLQE